MTKNARPPEPGDRLHWLVNGHGFHTVVHGQHVAFVAQRGQELTLTAEILNANRDRNGILPPWLGLLHDAEAQIRHFGMQLVGEGPWPLDNLRTLPGEDEHEEARREAVRTANAIEDEADRRAALRAVEEMFGPAQPTSRTLGRYAGRDQ